MNGLEYTAQMGAHKATSYLTDPPKCTQRNEHFQEWCWENWMSTHRRMKLDHLLLPPLPQHPIVSPQLKLHCLGGPGGEE